MSWMRLEDTISGAEGKATIKINGNQEEAFYIRTAEATFDLNKMEGKTLGKRGTQHKVTGWNGGISLNIYYVTSVFAKWAENYKNTGRVDRIDLTFENNDPASTIGRQTAVFYGFIPDSVTIAKLDIDADALDQDLNGTYEDFAILDQFGKPVMA